MLFPTPLHLTRVPILCCIADRSVAKYTLGFLYTISLPPFPSPPRKLWGIDWHVDRHRLAKTPFTSHEVGVAKLGGTGGSALQLGKARQTLLVIVEPEGGPGSACDIPVDSTWRHV